ncbi:hypothetical protein AVEN_239132-1 [Araneus ventricosus]|uniref:Uncharacterized protein n=1 Tax=Araneus ventricosus TaxID=182803 RepID=A0A4Y2NRM8_ARAVE|nr:hypothetical protein AVEN_239132-1 [Araneus ventricosus]
MLLYEKITEEDEVENSVVEYVFELINRMKKYQELAVKNMEDAKQKQKLWYDRKTVKRQFRPEKDKTCVYQVSMLKPYHQRAENINLLYLEDNLKLEDEEDMPNLELALLLQSTYG